MTADKICVALTGASGAQYGLRLLDCLLANQRAVDVIFSQAALAVLKLEMGISISARPREAQRQLCQRFKADAQLIRVYGLEEWTAPIASGSAVDSAMVICPCSMGSLAGIAAGTSRNLIERAADVTLKERRPLILVPREMPFSSIHLQNMLKLSQAGAIIMPPSPGFYHKPETLNDMIDFVVARVLDQLNISHQLLAPWGNDGI